MLKPGRSARHGDLWLRTNAIDRAKNMPGILGHIALRRPLEEAAARALVSPLLHYSHYSHTLLQHRKTCFASIAPGVSRVLAHTEQRRHLTVSYYGAFYSTPLASLTEPAAIITQLLEMFHRHGDALADHLNGSFVVSIYDHRQDRLLLTNDHNGSRPLFYHQCDSGFWFSPELSSFLTCSCGVTLSRQAAIQFLINGHLMNGQSLLQKISLLAPASTLIYHDQRTRVRSYAPFLFASDAEDRGEAYFCRKLGELLLAAVEARYRSPGETMVPISGGYDSRGIVGCLRALSDHPIRTVSWGICETVPEADAYIGRQVARAVGAEHHFVARRTGSFRDDFHEMVTLLNGMNDDPVFHANEIRVMQIIRQGLGARYLLRGDECFGFGHAAHSDEEAFARVGITLLRDYPQLQAMLQDRVQEALIAEQAVLDAVKESTAMTDFTDRKDYYYFSQRLFHYLNISSYYKMAVLELQNPWLDREIMRFYQNLPTKYRLDKGLYKKTLATLFPDLFAIPFAQKSSLEDWQAELRRNAGIKGLFQELFANSAHPIGSLLRMEKVKSLYEAQMAPGTPATRGPRVKSAMKAILSSIPWLYQPIKSIALKHGVSRQLDPAVFLLRVLELATVLQRFEERDSPRPKTSPRPGVAPSRSALH